MSAESKEFLSKQSLDAPKVTESVEIVFSGQRFTIKMMGDSEKNREVANLVQSRLREAEDKGGGKISSHWVAVHSLFQLAEEYVESKRRFQSYQKEIQSCLPIEKT